MAKRKKKKDRQADLKPAMGARQKRSGSSRERARYRQYTLWSLALLVAVAAVAGGWTVLKDDAQTFTTADSMSKPPEALASATPKTAPTESSPESTLPTPRLEIPEPEFDFGFVPQNVKVSHVFWLHAAGTDSLRIVKVNPG